MHPERPKDIHHRINKKCSHNGVRAYPIKVDSRLHRFFHALFGYKDTYQIAAMLNKWFINPEYFLEVRKRNIDEK